MLNFGTNDFDCFTLTSVGVALCDKYQQSKGKSLIAFCKEASSDDVEKLLFDLLEYYETHCIDFESEDMSM